ncbi:MAG: hypothetical protein IAE79_07895 [Anaerolinea sp.]|nr:hypothetical protein [Anaerolinea sp.]
MQPTLLDIILIIFGLFTLFGVVARPGFYWERGRIRRTREIIGDKNTAIMYFVMGSIMLVIGVVGFLGGF